MHTVLAPFYVSRGTRARRTRTSSRFSRYSCTPYSYLVAFLEVLVHAVLVVHDADALVDGLVVRVDLERLVVIGERELQVTLAEETVAAVQVQTLLRLLAFDGFVQQNDGFFVKS